MRVRQLGWKLGVDGLVTDRFGSFFLHLLNFSELLQRVACAWQLVVSEHVKHRAPFSTFHLVDVGATTVDLHSRDASSQGSLRKNLNGGAFANDVAWKWSVSGDKACRACGVEDTLYHRYWQCPSTQHLRDSLDPQVLSVLDDLPPVLTVHGWTLSSPFADEWRCRLIVLPDVVPSCLCDLTGDGPLHLFTDGSCFWPSEPAYRLAAWSVCVAASCSGSDAFTSHVAGGGCLSGLTQTAFRAELYAVCAALTYGALTSRPIVVYSDCKSVVTRACAMQHGVCCHKPNVHNSDLWQWLADLLVQVGPRVQFVKVKAHVVLAQTSSHRDLWLGCHTEQRLFAIRTAAAVSGIFGGNLWSL
jgi:ribonuclease HI